MWEASADVVPDAEGEWTFRVEGWSDPWETWVHNAEIKIPAGIDVSLMITEGTALFHGAAHRAREAGDTALLAELEQEYDYDGVQTCAVDGMCQTACPVLIDTGDLTRRLRAEQRGPVEQRAWLE